METSFAYPARPLLHHATEHYASVENGGMPHITMLSGKYSGVPAEKRKAAADIMNGHLLMMEIMMSNVTQLWITRSVSMLEERGMMRHTIKKRANELTRVSSDLIGRCNAHDRIQVEQFAAHIFPPLVEQYINDGGTVTQGLQSAFMKRFRNELDIIFLSTKNAVDKARIPHSEIVSSVEMVALMAHTGIEIYNFICRKVDALMAGIGSVKRIKSRHNEQILAAANEILRSLGCDKANLPEKEGADVRLLARSFHQELTDKSMIDTVNAGITAMQMNFIEYVIASIRLDMEKGSVGFSSLHTLLLRLGNKRNVRELLKEIGSIPLPGKGEDIFDFMENLPDSVPGSRLAEFRRLCLDDHIMTEPETEEQKELRTLRRFVYRHEEGLDLPCLRWLYWRFGTKKAVSDYLGKGGETMDRTVRRMKHIRCAELALDPGTGYRLNIGSMLNALRLERGITLRNFARFLGRKEDEVMVLERNTDFMDIPSETLVPLVTGLASVFGILPGHFLFMCLKEKESKDESYNKFIKHLEKLKQIDYGKQHQQGSYRTGSDENHL